MNIENLIKAKKSTRPFLPTNRVEVLTDFDHFPYGRFFRGVPTASYPIVMDREAGWRPREDRCYQVVKPITPGVQPEVCFEAACSTVYPCYPGIQKRNSDRNALNVAINNACTIQYR